MPEIKRKENIFFEEVLRKYTDEELKYFDSIIQPFYEEHEIRNPIFGKEPLKVRVLNFERLGKAYGAYDENGHVIITNITRSSYGTVENYDRPTRLTQLNNLLEQYYAWKFKENQIVQGYEQLASEVSDKLNINDINW